MPRLSCTCEKEGLVFSVTFLVQNIQWRTNFSYCFSEISSRVHIKKKIGFRGNKFRGGQLCHDRSRDGATYVH